jgi:AraC-like DNA-binding protein
MFLVRSGALDGYEKLVQRLGRNPIHIMSEVGLSTALLRDPNMYLSYSKVSELLEITASHCDEPLFGLLLSEAQSNLTIGDLGLTATQQLTIFDAIVHITKYIYLHADGININTIRSGLKATVIIDFSFDGIRGNNQLTQLSVGLIYNNLRYLTGNHESNFYLSLKQIKPEIQHENMLGHFKEGIQFSAVHDAVTFSSEWLDKSPHFEQYQIRECLQKNIQELKKHYPSDLRYQVSMVIKSLLSSSECSLELVANALNIHPRSLQNQLKSESLTYGGILQSIRKEIAIEQLCDPSCSITELALSLGYAEVSIFSRNFKQWFGVSPKEYKSNAVNKK